MAKKEKDNLPKTVEEESTEQTSSITYATEVVAIIAGLAAGEVEGIAGMCNVSGGMLGKNKNITKGVKVEVGTEEVSCDLYVNVEYGKPMQKVAAEAQEGVRKAIEAMTGLHVVRVDVHVQGISFEKENDAISAGMKQAVIPGEETAKLEEKPASVTFVDETPSAEEITVEASDEAEKPADGENA